MRASVLWPPTSDLLRFFSQSPRLRVTMSPLRPSRSPASCSCRLPLPLCSCPLALCAFIPQSPIRNPILCPPCFFSPSPRLRVTVSLIAPSPFALCYVLHHFLLISSQENAHGAFAPSDCAAGCVDKGGSRTAFIKLSLETSRLASLIITTKPGQYFYQQEARLC
jgi:hypothetical protein